MQRHAAHPILQLQRTAGNRVTQQLVKDRRRVVQRQPAPPLLRPAAAAAAVTDVTNRYDENSIRTLESFSGAASNGVFDAADAEALAKLQQHLSITPNGKADVATLNAMLGIVGPTLASRTALIHLVIDHANIDVSGALAVVHDPSLTTASSLQTLPGGVSTIRIGNAGFASYNVMVAEIRKQLAVRPATAPATAVGATVLTSPTLQGIAIALNKTLVKDSRSIKLLQGALGSKRTGQWDVDLVRHVAARQLTLGVVGMGTLDEPTLAAIVKDMIAAGSQDGVLQLIIDYYDLDRSHALNVVFDPIQPTATPTAEAETVTVGTGAGRPSVVRVFPVAFAQPFAGLVHTVAHELGHAQQTIQGIVDLNVREFLSEGIEIESKGMPAESLESDSDIDLMIRGAMPVQPGLLQDAQRMLHFWGRMTPADKQTHHQRYKDIRTVIVNRITNEGSSTQRTKLAPFIQRLANADSGVP